VYGFDRNACTKTAGARTIGAHATRVGSASSTQWSAYRSLTETRSSYLLEQGGAVTAVVIIPKRAFQSADDAVRRLRRRMWLFGFQRGLTAPDGELPWCFRATLSV
jgi:hypothetical protein